MLLCWGVFGGADRVLWLLRRDHQAGAILQDLSFCQLSKLKRPDMEQYEGRETTY